MATINHEPAPRLPADNDGGTCRAVIDLSVPAHERHPHRTGVVIVAHVGGGVGRYPVLPVFEMLDGGGLVDAHCLDCPSLVTLITDPPPCVSLMLVTEHDETCPALAARLLGRRP
ncbi:MAG TPA: hypothetical protein VMI33_17185 [Streptosporangiaceae bacterium]|nr:hypothetical protein [Streptosporangiaceae bacterium]